MTIRRKCIWWSVSATMAVTFGIFLLHREILFSTLNGWEIDLRQASILELAFGSKCNLHLKPPTGQPQSVELLQDWFRSPIVVIPSSKTNILFCVYDNDVDWQAIRIHADLPFAKIAQDSPLAGVVLRATCRIERVLKNDTNDWHFMSDAVRQMSPRQFGNEAVHFGFLRTSKEQLAHSLQNFGDQGQYPGDVFIPHYIKSRNTNNEPAAPF